MKVTYLDAVGGAEFFNERFQFHSLRTEDHGAPRVTVTSRVVERHFCSIPHALSRKLAMNTQRKGDAKDQYGVLDQCGCLLFGSRRERSRDKERREKP